MIRNGKFFVAPQHSTENFKVLFARLVTQGVGRPVDKHDFADGPWTPETLADAIATIDSNKSGIDVRTVQVWFQANDNGISDKNIHWLARIFGCDDPVATSQWQSELKAAKERLAEERRSKNKLKSESVVGFKATPDKLPLHNAKSTMHVAAIQRRKSPSSLASKSERLFLGGGPFGMVVVMWASVAVLLYASYLLGTHDITYTPVEGVEKQVGLFWSPNWLLDKLIWLPLIVFAVSSSVASWRERWRPALTSGELEPGSSDRWETKLAVYSVSFLGITIVCVMIVFLLQWYGAYLYPLSQNEAGARVVDWLLVALERPEVISVSEAIAVSMFANLLSGIGYWCCFTGFLFLHIISTDFRDICSKSARHFSKAKRFEALVIGNNVLQGVFTCTVFALLISTGIKLVAVYLMTDAENILHWLAFDALSLFGQHDGGWNWFDKSPSASITSFFVMFIPVFVYFLCLSQILHTLQALFNMPEVKIESEIKPLKVAFSELRMAWLAWSGIILILVTNFWLIGRFTGFSVVLAMSTALALYTVVATRKLLGQEHTMAENHHGTKVRRL